MLHWQNDTQHNDIQHKFAQNYSKKGGRLYNKIYAECLAWNKSSLLLKIILQNTQTLRLFTRIIKTGNIYKNY
jgi:hypothetical protein